MGPDGPGQAFPAGDVVLGRRGAAYEWQSHRIRTFRVIFDTPAAGAD